MKYIGVGPTTGTSLETIGGSMGAMNEYNLLSMAASSNKSLFVRFLNEQVEEGFYTLVIDYLKDNDFDLTKMNITDDVRDQSSKLFALQEFVNEHIKAEGKYEIEEWIEPLFRFVYGEIDPFNIDTNVAGNGIYRYSVWLVYLYQREKFEEAMRLIGEKVAPQLINCYYQALETEERHPYFDKAVMGYLDLISVVMDMDISNRSRNSEAYLNNLEVLYDYLIEDDNIANDYKIQFSMGLFNEYIKNLSFEKAFEFYGLNAEHIPVDNLKVYDGFKELIRHCDNTQYTSVLNRAVVTALSKQEIYNKRIDGLIVEVSNFIHKVYKYIEEEPMMKKSLQILGAGSSLADKSNIFEGLYEYNLVFYECGIKALVNQDVSNRSWDEKYEILDMLYSTLNVLFAGASVYEISNRIEHQYIELNWIGAYVNGNPALLKGLFSVKEKIKAFKVRKTSIVEKNKANKEIKVMLEDRQKHLVFMTADDMIQNGLENGKINIINTNYDTKKAEKFFMKSYNEVVLSGRYKPVAESGGRFGFGGGGAKEDEARRLLKNPKLAEMIFKAEWLWFQFMDKDKEQQSPEERTYSIACLIKAVEIMISRKSNEAQAAPEENSNKRVIITKTGKVIELSDETSQAPTGATPKKPEVNVIYYLNNIDKFLKEPSEENVEYVKNYINEWLKDLMELKFDRDNMLSMFEAEELRSKTLKVLKKLNYDMIPM